MLKGIITSNISNLYNVEAETGKTYSCNARGKFKNDEISPVAGDKVEIDIVDEEKNVAVVNKIEERVNYIKRPKMANLTQIIFVVSMKLPKPDLELLDKQLAYSEYMKIKPIICLNKVDLENEEIINNIEKLYTSVRLYSNKNKCKRRNWSRKNTKSIKKQCNSILWKFRSRKIYTY